MSSSNAWAEFSSVFRRTREVYVEHENAKARPAKQANITVTLPKPMTSGAKADGRFGKQDFVYSAAGDVYRCSHRHTNEEDGKITPLLDDGVPTLPAQVSVYDGRGTGGERRITHGSMSTCSKPSSSVSMPIRKQCASVARRSSIPSRH